VRRLECRKVDLSRLEAINLHEDWKGIVLPETSQARTSVHWNTMRPVSIWGIELMGAKWARHSIEEWQRALPTENPDHR
jgi:hypothetical protein